MIGPGSVDERLKQERKGFGENITGEKAIGSVIPKEYCELENLIRAFVQEKRPEFPKEPDWNRLMQLSQIHGVSGITAYMISQYRLASEESINAAAKTLARQTVVLFVRRGEQTKQLLKELNDREIDHGMLKGYVIRNCYPIPELRSYGDMDLVIHPEKRQPVHQMMTELGFDTKTSWEPVYSYVRGNELYEFHTEIMEVDVSDKANYREYFRSVWEHMIPEQGHTFTPDPEYHFLYLLCHIAKHIAGSGAGLRMYLDIAFYLKSFGDIMDWTWVQDELEALKLEEFTNTVFTAVERWFGVQSPLPLKPISEEIMEDFFAFTMEGGTFGHAGRASGVIALKKTDRNRETVSRPGTLIHRLFPSAETIEKRYTYLKGRHWLLPVAWIHRLIITRETWGEHAREARTILTADEETVLRLKKLYSEIGL